MASVAFHFFNQYRATGKIKIFEGNDGYANGEQRRDFVSIEDVVRVNLHFLDNENVSGIFNLGTGKARSWNDLASALFTAMGREKNIHYVDMPENIRSAYQYFTQAEMEKLQKAGYTLPFTELENAVQDYVQSYLMQPQQYL